MAFFSSRSKIENRQEIKIFRITNNNNNKDNCEIWRNFEKIQIDFWYKLKIKLLRWLLRWYDNVMAKIFSRKILGSAIEA